MKGTASWLLSVLLSLPVFTSPSGTQAENTNRLSSLAGPFEQPWKDGRTQRYGDPLTSVDPAVRTLQSIREHRVSAIFRTLVRPAKAGAFSGR
jgi:hypothetical protein